MGWPGNWVGGWVGGWEGSGTPTGPTYLDTGLVVVGLAYAELSARLRINAGLVVEGQGYALFRETPTPPAEPPEDTPVPPSRMRWRQAPARGWLALNAGRGPAPGSGSVQ